MIYTQEQARQAIEALSEGSDLDTPQKMSCVREVLAAIIEKSLGERELLKSALPIARRSIGAGVHLPSDPNFYASQTISFCKEHMETVRHSHLLEEYRDHEDPEAFCMAHLAEMYMKVYKADRVH